MIFLTSVVSQYPDELLADFQEYYNIDLYDLIFSANNKICKDRDKAVRLGTLLQQLPAGSRVMRELVAQAGWNDSTQILSQLEYDTRCLLHAFLSANNKKYKPDWDKIEPMKPTNKAERQKRIKGNRKMSVDGHEIQAVSREELKAAFGH